MVAAAAIGAVPHLKDVHALLLCRVVDQRIAAPVAEASSDLDAARIDHFQHGLELRVNTPCEALGEHSLVLLQGELVVILVRRAVGSAVDRRSDRDLHRLLDAVVPFLLLDIRSEADLEETRVRDAEAADGTQLVDTRGNLLADGHRELSGEGTCGRLRQACSDERRVNLGGRLHLHRRGDAGVREDEARDVVDVGAADRDVERSSLLTADGLHGSQADDWHLGTYSSRRQSDEQGCTQQRATRGTGHRFPFLPHAGLAALSSAGSPGKLSG